MHTFILHTHNSYKTLLILLAIEYYNTIINHCKYVNHYYYNLFRLFER